MFELEAELGVAVAVPVPITPFMDDDFCGKNDDGVLLIEFELEYP